MPWLTTDNNSSLLDIQDAVLPVSGGSLADRLLNIWIYPASVFASVVIVGACVLVLARRGRSRRARELAFLWLVGNLVELVGKSALRRPALHVAARGANFAHSYPSGHTIRAALVAAALCSLSRRARFVAIPWAVSVAILLVPLSDHVPSDVAAGALVAAALLWGVGLVPLGEKRADCIVVGGDGQQEGVVPEG